MTDDDSVLVRRIVSGDQAALATVFDRFAPVLTRYAWAVSATPADVARAVQDTFLSLWEQADGVHVPTGRLLPWLFAVCRSHAGPGGEDPSGSSLRWVRDDLLALPDTDRRLVDLCVVEGRTWPQALQLLGLPAAAPTSRRRSGTPKEVQR